jgi:hypothetical protein
MPRPLILRGAPVVAALRDDLRRSTAVLTAAAGATACGAGPVADPSRWPTAAHSPASLDDSHRHARRARRALRATPPHWWRRCSAHSSRRRSVAGSCPDAAAAPQLSPELVRTPARPAQGRRNGITPANAGRCNSAGRDQPSTRKADRVARPSTDRARRRTRVIGARTSASVWRRCCPRGRHGHSAVTGRRGISGRTRAGRRRRHGRRLPCLAHRRDVAARAASRARLSASICRRRKLVADTTAAPSPRSRRVLPVPGGTDGAGDSFSAEVLAAAYAASTTMSSHAT